MKERTAAEVRERFLAFFEARGHARLPSDSLVPANDPTLLFTGAGMNQFKDMFLGRGSLPHRRVVTSQKCLRVPDLDKVGKTPRHHTFFEMLGNFSFGDYFKEDCIAWEWAFFTEELGIPGDHLVVTVYENDDEAAGIWRDQIGVPEDKIFRFGEKENFWPAEAPSKGPNGPCGPCSEIYYDLHPERPLPAVEGLGELPEDRFTELGNCVFTQFDRQDDGTLAPLPQCNIDVGLGLERITATLQGAPNNFETDLFRPLLDELGRRTGTPYGKDQKRDERMRRIADHVRAVTFCIADGALPGNEGRGYVVRKILRRACRDGFELGLEQPFLHEMVPIVGEVMGDAYPEVRENAPQCRALMRSEEESFAAVYRRGSARLEEFIAGLGARRAGRAVPGTGAFAFELHDTFGFPADITRSVLADRGIPFDEGGFEAAMAAQRERARAAQATTGSVFAENVAMILNEQGVPRTVFTGYQSLREETGIAALLGADNTVLEAADPGTGACLAIVPLTPFYAQGGGQVGDRGTLRTATGHGRVVTCSELDGYHLHRIEVEEGTVEPGQEVILTVDQPARRATERNHSATHLLHAALKEVLGAHVSQAGSEVGPARLRFDFTHMERLTATQIAALEERVAAEIMAATPVQAVVRPLDEARAAGFVALFGEKYGDQVRTLAIGPFSKELCGGTHVANSGNIGAFRIVGEQAISAGTRRIEAVTGPAATALGHQERGALQAIARALKVPVAETAARVQDLVAESKRLRKELQQAQAADLGAVVADIEKAAVAGDAGRSAVVSTGALTMKELQEVLIRARKKLAPFACVLFAPGADGVLVGAAVDPSLTDRVRAGDLVKELTGLLGGGGGGRPEMAQGKGTDRGGLEAAAGRARELLATAGLGG